MREQRERELKFDVPVEWSMPELDALVPPGGDLEAETLHLQTTYYDTASCSLLARGVTLRRRSGDADAGWQLKVPDGNARTELRLPPNAGTAVPAEMRDLVVGLRAGSPLRRAATLETTRVVHRIRSAMGAVLEIADDTVRATAFGAVPVLSKWREVEIELFDGSEDDLAAAARYVGSSGLTPAVTSSKLARALNYTRTGAPQADPGSLPEIVQRYLTAQYDAIVLGDIALRRGHDAIHQVRVATRRLRSALRGFDALFEADRGTALAAELRWYGGVLGAVRDHQVLRGHLLGRVDELGEIAEPATARLTSVLDDGEEQALAALHRAMSGRRYVALLRELHAWCEVPPLLDPTSSPAALAPLVQSIDRRRRKQLSRWSQRPDDEEAMHDARKAAKRARYAAELAGPVLDTSVISERTERVQRRLGLAQDCVAASQLLLRAASGAEGEEGFALGVLWSAEQAELDELRRKARRTLK